MKVTFYGERFSYRITSILIESSHNTKILLDCGIKSKDHRESVLPDELILDIDAIFLTHAHQDHWGYLPFVIKKSYSNPIYLTYPTFDLLKEVAVKLDFKFLVENEKPEYQKNLRKLYNLINKQNYGKPINVKNLNIYFLPANHILGSAQILVEEKDTKKQILYTGDFNPQESILFSPITIENLQSNFEISINPETVIIECSKVDIKNENLEKETIEFVSNVNNTYRNLGNVFIPCKAIGDAQEFLARYIHYCLEKKLFMPKLILTDGALIAVNEIYFKYQEFFRNPNLVKLFKTTLIIKKLKDFIEDDFAEIEDLHFKNNPYNYGFTLYIATGSNLEGGSALRIYKYLKDNPKNLIIMPSKSRKLTCKAKVINSNLFSLHGNFDSIMKYIIEIENNKKSKYFLIHGSTKNLNFFKKYLKSLKFSNIIPKPGETFNL